MKAALLTLLVVSTGALPVRAATIVGVQSSGDYGYFQEYQMAQQFRTGSGSVTLESLTLRVTNNFATVLPPTAGADQGFWVMLFSDNADQIGSVLTTFTIQGDYFSEPASEYDIPTYVSFLPDLQVTLQEDTNYWIGIENFNSYSWLYAQSATFEGTGSFGRYFMTTGGYNEWGGPTTFDMTVTGAAAVPEPSGSILCLAGAAGVLAARRRHRPQPRGMEC